jgi:hypothetical protein
MITKVQLPDKRWFGRIDDTAFWCIKDTEPECDRELHRMTLEHDTWIRWRNMMISCVERNSNYG